jgi:hypothetical protein
MSGLEPATASLARGSRFEDRYEILGELGAPIRVWPSTPRLTEARNSGSTFSGT